MVDAHSRLIVNVAIPLYMPPSILGGPLSAYPRRGDVKERIAGGDTGPRLQIDDPRRVLGDKRRYGNRKVEGQC